MEFEEWEPYYEKILEEFGYNRKEDELSARILDRKLAGSRIELSIIIETLKGKVVTVTGNATSLVNEMRSIEGILITADEATSVMMRAGMIPKILVTDLDGDIEDQIRANERGTVAVIHAHGDNIPKVEKYASEFKGKVVGTTQSRPFGKIFNFGGFTDGDRAVLLAHHFNASSIRLLGFDFENPSPKDENPDVKRRKLTWAHKLIQKIGII
ncbi:MAG: 6-hydroxymethylpterin diphosphokinase MptE-like protein [Candidatus Hodarchaeota archaeon]